MVNDSDVDEFLVGAVDTHVHSGPSTASRSLDHVELVEQASAVGYAAVVTKDHYYSGAPSATLVNAHYGHLGTRMFSGVALNNTVGGLNAYAVEHSANMGGKLVWLPTFNCRNHAHWQENDAPFHHPGHARSLLPERPIEVLDGDGNVVDALKEVLDVIAQTDSVLATGHLHISEIHKVVQEAKRRGVDRIVLTHPEEILGADLSDVRALTAEGVFVEHSMCLFIPSSRFRCHTSETLRAQIDAAGVQHTIIATDLGQADATSPIDGMREAIKMLFQIGMNEDEVRAMTSSNARTVLGI